MGSLRVVRVLERLIAKRGAPQRIRSDNVLKCKHYFCVLAICRRRPRESTVLRR